MISGLMEHRCFAVRMRTGVIAMLAVAVTGCATLGGASLTENEQALRDDSQAFTETVLGGAATGALAGGGLCMLTGKSLQDCLGAAAIGGALGAAGGYAVATKQAAANENVAQTDIVTRDIEADNQKLGKLVASTRNVVQENRAAVEALKARVASKEAEAGEVEALQARLRSNADLLNNTIGKLNERKDTYTETLASMEGEGEDTTALRQEVSEMEDQIAQLVEYRSALEDEIDVELMG